MEDSNNKPFLLKTAQFTNEDIEKMMSYTNAVLFGLIKDVDIDLELVKEAISYAKDLNSIPVLNRKPQPAKVVKELNQIINLSEKLFEKIKKFHDEGYLSAIIVDEHNEYFLSTLNDLIHEDGQVSKFINLSKHVKNSISTLKSESKSASFKQDELIKKLADIYTKLTGQRPTVTYRSDQGSGEYSGGFIIFCNSVARVAFGKSWSETQLANTIKRLYPPDIGSD